MYIDIGGGGIRNVAADYVEWVNRGSGEARMESINGGDGVREWRS